MDVNLAYKDEIGDELINGEIVMMSPRPLINHNRVSGNIYAIFSAYLKGKTCEAFGDGVDLYLTEKDRFIPDGMIVCNKDIIHSDGVHGAPDLVVEVLSPSTSKRDKTYKYKVYEDVGVREYWIVSPESKSIEVYHLTDSQLVLDEIYSIYPEALWGKLTEQERSEVKLSFKCSLYDDLEINLEDVFARLS